MITDHDAERCLDYIRDTAALYAQAKADRVYLEQFRKSKKAILVRECSGTIQERDSYAYAHREYQELLLGLKEAVHEEERLKWLLIGAQAKLDAWRTMSANERKATK